MVVEATLEALMLLTAKEGRKASIRELTLAFFTANLHDAGKFNIHLKTRTGYTVAAESAYNPYDVNLVVPPKASEAQTISDMGLDTSKMTWLDYFMASVFTHQDAEAVWQLLCDLVRIRFISRRERNEMWDAIQEHGFASGYIMHYSKNKPVGIRSHVFDIKASHEYLGFEAIAMELKAALKGNRSVSDITHDPGFATKLQRVKTIQRRLSLLKRALNAGDRVGQNDLIKYVDILVNKSAVRNLTFYQLIFGKDLSENLVLDWRDNTFVGVLATEEDDLILIEPELGARTKKSFDVTRQWLNAPAGQPGLTQAVLDDKVLRTSFEYWKQMQMANQNSNVLAWLDHIKIYNDEGKNPEFLNLRLLIKRALYNYYAADPSTNQPSRFTLAGKE
jgi:hypothetical protein